MRSGFPSSWNCAFYWSELLTPQKYGFESRLQDLGPHARKNVSYTSTRHGRFEATPDWQTSQGMWKSMECTLNTFLNCISCFFTSLLDIRWLCLNSTFSTVKLVTFGRRFYKVSWMYIKHVWCEIKHAFCCNFITVKICHKISQSVQDQQSYS